MVVKNIKINLSNAQEDLNLNLYSQGKEKELLIFIGGSGDDRNYYDNICRELVVATNWDVLTYSIRGVETGCEFPIYQQILDLREVMEYLESSKTYQRYLLVSTSIGSIAMSAMLVDPVYGIKINKALYLDPADYYLKLDSKVEPETWSGGTDYHPTEPTVSSMLAGIKSEVVVSVVGFSLRNYKNNDYAFKEYSKRGGDAVNGHPRLSQEMTRSFFENCPLKNRGVFVDNHSLPHGFERDGDVPKNEKEVVSLIKHLMESSYN